METRENNEERTELVRIKGMGKSQGQNKVGLEGCQPSMRRVSPAARVDGQARCHRRSHLEPATTT